MSVERVSANHVDLLDHVLDKGIVIDAWVSLSLAGIDLMSIEARVVVASIETYLKHVDTVAHAGTRSRSGIAAAAPIGFTP